MCGGGSVCAYLCVCMCVCTCLCGGLGVDRFNGFLYSVRRLLKRYIFVVGFLLSFCFLYILSRVLCNICVCCKDVSLPKV